MNNVLRIVDKFNITGRGIVYLVEHSKDAVIRMGDTFYDLRGNEFKVKGIEMIRRIPDGKSFEEMPIGLLFEAVDGVDAEGSILVDDLNGTNFIFCNHPLYPKKVDEDYAEEYEEARADHECALFSFEDLEKGKLTLFGDIKGLTIYRGWMMKPEMYQKFYTLLAERDIILINSPEEYNRYHLLPGWYEDFAEDTAKSVWDANANVERILKKASDLNGPYIVKDYVKSRKHEWYDACYIRDIANVEEAKRVITNFIDRQGDNLVGGVVLREFLNLKANGYHEKSGMPLSEEYRVFIFANKHRVIDNYWGKGSSVNLSTKELDWIDSIAARVKSNFVTLDLARKEDGSLVIMEFGDGQVSGLQDIGAVNFYLNMSAALSTEPFFQEGTVIMSADPMPDKSIEAMRRDMTSIETTQQIVDLFVLAHNKFWFIEDDIYDYEEGTDEYNQVRAVVDAWGDIMDELQDRLTEAAIKEGFFKPDEENPKYIETMKPFMQHYGYRDGRGWWVREE